MTCDAWFEEHWEKHYEQARYEHRRANRWVLAAFALIGFLMAYQG
jgi:hypothetical protein